jgi:hypothetical protein
VIERLGKTNPQLSSHNAATSFRRGQKINKVCLTPLLTPYVVDGVPLDRKRVLPKKTYVQLWDIEFGQNDKNSGTTDYQREQIEYCPVHCFLLANAWLTCSVGSSR